MAGTSTEGAIPDDERVDVLAALDRTLRLEAQNASRLSRDPLQPLSIGDTCKRKTFTWPSKR